MEGKETRKTGLKKTNPTQMVMPLCMKLQDAKNQKHYEI
jgi:hypothetical protein